MPPTFNERGSIASVLLLMPVFLGGLIGYCVCKRDRVAGAYRGFAIGLFLDMVFFAWTYHSVVSYSKNRQYHSVFPLLPPLSVEDYSEES